MSHSDSKRFAQQNLAFQHDIEGQQITLGQEDKIGSSSSVAASHQVTYTWNNIDVHVDIKQGNLISRLRNKTPTVQKRILENVSGAVQPGEFLAILGASGAGKTTLLNCLTFRTTGKLKISGERNINGRPINTDSLARMSAYVQQDDLFIGTLTVKEQLRFQVQDDLLSPVNQLVIHNDEQALLRMDKHLTYRERMSRVEEVMQELGLSKSADTMIGNSAKGVKGISGGEKKRLAFACEILTNPPLMFCDEPTSGLDSYMAQNIVQVLRKLASRGKTIICTIHQPSSEVFAMFDRILLMAEGRTAYLGPANEALSFFSSMGLPCPPNYNPADFYIHTLATVPGQEQESRNRIKEICNGFESSEMGQSILRTARENKRDAKYEIENQNDKVRSPYKASWFSQFRAVLWRSWISVIREPAVLRVKAFQTIFIAGLIAAIFQGQEYTISNLSNIQGALFIFLTNMTFQNVFGVVNVITTEIPIFLREHFNGMYRTDVYFLCKTLADLPIYLFFPWLFLTIPYFAIGFNPAADRYFTAAGIVILVANVATSFGYFVSCLTSSVQVASALAAPLIIPMLLFGGFFLRGDSIPVYFEWLSYLSWFKYGNEMLSINQWLGVTFNDTSTDSFVACPDGQCTGELVLQFFAYDPDNFYVDLGCMFALLVGLRVLAVLALLKKTYRK
nr:ABCG2-like1 protein [Diaphanosoma celebensis]